ncbi:MFS transporter, partial [Bacillus sp. SIMBA_074]
MDYFTVVMIAIAITTGVFGYSAKMEKGKDQPVSVNNEQGVSMFKAFSQLVQNPFLFKCSVLMLVT